jgi:tripartite-type tricarboxylate transporter receptor subunit TctC
MKFARRLTVCIAALLVSAAAQSQDSRKPFKMVVPFAAGSATDAMARVLAQDMGADMNAPFVVENRPGASGQIGADFVAKSAPDGHTLLLTSHTTHAANPSLFKTLPYDPIKDFTAVSRTGDVPSMLVVGAKFPVNSVKELIALAKANPGKLNFGVGNSTSWVAGAMFNTMAGIDVVPVQYKSSPQALTDVIGGRVELMFIDMAAGLAQVKAGAIKALAVATPERVSLTPELPTMAESGLAGFGLISWTGVYAPAGTPREMVAALSQQIAKTLAKPDVRKRLAGFGYEPVSSTPQEFADFTKSEIALWGARIKSAGIQPE